MKPDFALSLSVEGIALLHRAPDGWRAVGDVPLDSPDLAAALSGLRDKAKQLSPRGFTTKLVIPNEQIRYLALETGDLSAEDRLALGAAALEGATPYAVEDLAFDIAADGPMTHVAAVANETLDEARAFAEEHDFNPVSFVAAPNGLGYPAEPFFGLTPRAESWTGPAAVEPDGEEVSVIGPAILPAPEPDPVADPVPDTAPKDAPKPKTSAETPGKPKAEPVAAPAAKVSDRPAKAPAPEPTASGPTAKAPGTSGPGDTAVAEKPADTTAKETPAASAGPAPAFQSARKRGESPTPTPTPVKAPPQADPVSQKSAAPAESESAAPVTGFSSRRRPSGDEPVVTAPAGGAEAAPSLGTPSGATKSATAPAPGPIPEDGGPKVGTPSATDAATDATPAFSATRNRTDGEGTKPRAKVAIPPKSAPDAAKPAPRGFGKPGANALSGTLEDDESSGLSKLFGSLRERIGNTTGAMSVAAENRRLAKAEEKSRKEAAKKSEAAAAARATPGLGGGFPTGTDTLKPVRSPAALAKIEKPKPATAAEPEDDEARRMTIFGAREEPAVGGKPRYLGLILTLTLLLVLAGVAAWATVFVDGGLSSLIRRGADREPPVEIAIIPNTPGDAAQDAPETAAKPDVIVPDAILPGDAAPEAAGPETDLPETAAPEMALPDSVDPEPSEPETVAAPEPPVVQTPETARAAAEALYAATGIWTGPPETPEPLTQTGIDDVHQIGIDHRALARPTRALPALPDTGRDTPLERTAALDPALEPEPRTRSDAVAAVEDPAPESEAASAPAEPEITEPDVAEPEIAAIDPDLIGVRPRLRPAEIEQEAQSEADPEAETTAETDETAPEAETAADESTAEDAVPVDPGLRPRLRPESIVAAAQTTEEPAEEDAPAAEETAPDGDDQDNTETDDTAPTFDDATARAVALSIAPKPRPEGFAERARQLAEAREAEAAARQEKEEAREHQLALAAAAKAAAAARAQAEEEAEEDEPARVASVAPRAVSPGVPSTATVARRATLTNAINLRRVNLIGVYGTPSNRRALVRLQNGRYKKVQVGDRIDGGRIVAIGDSELRYQKNGRNTTLKIPSG
ncbi:hypothetical protein [Chachezhania antarctica]|uniref:hypothetical protein n=1 Tax=Chachezhania antarctica TaxID=2340860 RepID=UPI000EAF3BEF|nr:hypothetical protein [Chachezhania antarctica]